MVSNIAPEIRSVLEEEREILVTGRLDELTALIPRKTLALDALSAMPPDADLDHLKRLAERNTSLLQAAISGVASARERLAGHAKPTGILHTYTSDGRRVDVHTARPKVERRR